MKHFRQALTICLVLISGTLILNSSGFSAEVDGYDVTLHQLHLRYLNTPVLYAAKGLITVGYTPETNGIYLNILAMDNTFAPQWIVRNLYLPNDSFISEDQEISVRFCLSLLGYTDGAAVPSVLLHVVEGNSILTTMPASTLSDFVAVTADTLGDDAMGDDSAVESEESAIDPYDPFHDYTEDAMKEVLYRGCAVPNIDLDDFTYPSEEGYAGDRYGCGPASAANSLKWLSDTNEEISISTTTREIMADLSEKMGRLAGDGVTINQFILGKLDYIESEELSINVKFQSMTTLTNIVSSTGVTHARCENTGTYPTWDYLKQQLNDQEDVEVMYYWQDGEVWHGHAVTLSGCTETNSGLKSIYFKHDVQQSSTGGTIQEKDDIVVDGHGRMILRKRGAFIGQIVAESPGSPFPVEMSLFDAYVKNNSVHFEWETASESNNYGFEILRNAEKVGFVEGNGTTAKSNHYDYVDKVLAAGSYHYEIYQIDFDGSRTLAGKYDAQISAGVKQFALSQNYPNPFNAMTTIHYNLAKQSAVTMEVYNLLGEVVATLVEEVQAAGSHSITFDAKDLSSGIYYYRLQTDNFSDFRKFILIK